MAILSYFVALLVGAITFIILFAGMIYLDRKYDIVCSFVGVAIFTFSIIIPVIAATVITFCAFWNIKETYKVIDVKDNGFYSQEILIEDDDNTYLLKDISGEYEVGDEIKLSVIYVEQNGDKIN